MTYCAGIEVSGLDPDKSFSEQKEMFLQFFQLQTSDYKCKWTAKCIPEALPPPPSAAFKRERGI